ncbi:MAG TPA: hypothetical protein VGQ17_08570 [Gemmatimonadales bacterium]|nr:hypothetical protein [Gemmatimonadales bacterium]
MLVPAARASRIQPVEALRAEQENTGRGAPETAAPPDRSLDAL